MRYSTTAPPRISGRFATQASAEEKTEIRALARRAMHLKAIQRGFLINLMSGTKPESRLSQAEAEREKARLNEIIERAERRQTAAAAATV